MSDPFRLESAHSSDARSAAARDAKVEQLLLDGLDHYFSSRYEQAIHVWTRALFIDRSHPRARAYIDRARSALAERQRESEELLQTGIAAFNRGEVGEARRFLQDALSRGAPSDEVLALLERLNRMEPGAVPVCQPVPVRAARRRSTPPAVRVRRPFAAAGVWLALAALLVAAGAWLVVSTGYEWPSLAIGPTGPASVPVRGGDGRLPIPQRGQAALARARTLANGGRLSDALRTLDLVRPTDSQKTDADRLRADIQRQLIALTVKPANLRAGDPASSQP